MVYGTVGDDRLEGGNHPQVLMGLDGDDTLIAGNAKDCLVGGPGNDRLYGGNAKDILLGGPGDDYLQGDNAPDWLDGGEGNADICVGGGGHDTVINCELDAAPAVAETANAELTTKAQDSDGGAKTTDAQADSSEVSPKPKPVESSDQQPSGQTQQEPSSPAPTEPIAPHAG